MVVTETVNHSHILEVTALLSMEVEYVGDHHLN